MNWLDKLERKFGKYAIHNLMYYTVYSGTGDPDGKSLSLYTMAGT